MSRLDRDLKLLAFANLLFALGFGMYLQLLFVYAMDLGASRFTIGLLNAAHARLRRPRQHPGRMGGAPLSTSRP